MRRPEYHLDAMARSKRDLGMGLDNLIRDKIEFPALCDRRQQEYAFHPGKPLPYADPADLRRKGSTRTSDGSALLPG